jgi:DNA repair protein RecO (recombination protein O)
MEETFNTKAIILNRQPFKENDTKVSVFCLARGRLELVARGTKKQSSKMAGHLEPISLSNIMVVRGKQYNYVGSAINENAFLNIKNDYDKIFVAGEAINIFRKLVKENERDEILFKLLYNFLETVNSCRLKAESCKLLFNYFLLKMLATLGHKPELHNCVVCKNKIAPGGNKFDLAKGGVVCATTLTPRPSPTPAAERERGALLTISDNCIKVLRLAVSEDFEKLIKLKIDNKLEKEVDLIISSFYKYHF